MDALATELVDGHLESRSSPQRPAEEQETDGLTRHLRPPDAGFESIRKIEDVRQACVAEVTEPDQAGGGVVSGSGRGILGLAGRVHG
ncbi:MAG: hypothetical protein ACJA2W_002025 [Planctomycetota bacterium]